MQIYGTQAANNGQHISNGMIIWPFHGSQFSLGILGYIVGIDNWSVKIKEKYGVSIMY